MEEALPQYKRLHRELKEKIVSGSIAKGALLPSENELCAAYNITRATVRQGLQELVKEGFIEKRTGIGSVVVNDRNNLGLLTFKGFSEVLESTSLSSTTQNLCLEKRAVWPTPFFYELSEAEKKAGYFFFERLRSVEQQPVMLELTYIPGMDIDDFLDKMSNVSLFSTLFRTYKIEVLKVLQDVRAVGAPTEVARQLRLEPDEPLLHIHRKYLTTKPDFHIYSSLFCNTQKYALSNFFS